MTTAVVTVQADQPVREALRLLADRPFHQLPVLQGAWVVGVVSDRALFALLTRASQALDARAGEVMAANPRCIAPEAAISEAARLLVHVGVCCLPVVHDGTKVLQGIVTATDLLRMLL